MLILIDFVVHFHLNLLETLLDKFLLYILNLNLPITVPAVARHCTGGDQIRHSLCPQRLMDSLISSQIFNIYFIMMRSEERHLEKSESFPDVTPKLQRPEGKLLVIKEKGWGVQVSSAKEA